MGYLAMEAGEWGDRDPKVLFLQSQLLHLLQIEEPTLGFRKNGGPVTVLPVLLRHRDDGNWKGSVFLLFPTQEI